MSSPNHPATSSRRPRLMHHQWVAHIERCAKTQQTYEAYCQQHDLSIQTLKKHLCRYRRQKNVKAVAVESFIPVRVMEASAEVLQHYELSFSKGLLLKIPTSESLVSILKSLRGYV